MTIYGDIEQIVSTTHDTCAMLSQFKNGGDALLLYFRYIQQKKMQDNNQTYSTDTFMMQAMKWGKERFYKAKNILKDKGFIEHVGKQGEDGKFQGWYVKVNFVMSISTLHENHSPENQEGGNQETNTLVTKENTLVTKEKKNIGKIIDFEIFKSKIDLSFYKEIYNEQDIIIELKCCFDHYLEKKGGIVIATTAFNNRVKRGIKFGNIRQKPKETPKDNSHIQNIYDLSHLQGQI